MSSVGKSKINRNEFLPAGWMKVSFIEKHNNNNCNDCGLCRMGAEKMQLHAISGVNGCFLGFDLDYKSKTSWVCFALICSGATRKTAAQPSCATLD